MADTSREPSKAGCVIVETYFFVGVICMIFFELMSVAYLSFLEYDMTKGMIFVYSSRRY